MTWYGWAILYAAVWFVGRGLDERFEWMWLGPLVAVLWPIGQVIGFVRWCRGPGRCRCGRLCPPKPARWCPRCGLNVAAWRERREILRSDPPTQDNGPRSSAPAPPPLKRSRGSRSHRDLSDLYDVEDLT